jgi:hypothetical protein
MAGSRMKSQDRTGEPGQSLSKAKTFSRHYRLIETILISASYINGICQNQAMAQPGERQVQRRPEETLQMAERAFSALRSYVLTGAEANRSEFLRIWSANSQDDNFFNRVQQSISANPEVFRNLLVAYNSRKGSYPSPEEFVAALQACYSELRRPRAERSTAGIIGEYGPAFVAEVERMITSRSVPVRIPSQVQGGTIDHLLSVLSSHAAAAGTPQERMRSLIDEVDRSFSLHSFQAAERVAQALLYAYNLIDPQARPRFDIWLRHMTPQDKAALALQISSSSASRQLRLPYEYVRSAFGKWSQTREAKRREVAQMEADLRAYPSFIRDGTLHSLGRSFSRAPSDYGLENLGRRLEYVRKRIRMLELMDTPASRRDITGLRDEISSFESWLHGLGIRDQKAESGLARLAAGIRALQSHYYSMNPENPGLIDYLVSVNSNSPLSMIYRRYVQALDQRTARLFTGIEPSSPDYLQRMRARILQRISPSHVRRGQAQWLSDYYPLLSPALAPQPTASPSPLTAANSAYSTQIYNMTSTLEPLLAVTFLDYLGVASRNGLMSIQERRLIAGTVSRLYAVSPLLVVKYFAAVKNLAEICQDNSEAFLQALTVVAARIDYEAAAVTSGVSPTQVLPLNVRRVISHLASSLEEISRLDAHTLAQYDRLNLLDDRIIIQPYQPHPIEQRPPGYAPNLLVSPSQPGALFPPYPFPVSLLTPTPTSPFTAGTIFTTPPTYGGSLTLPAFNPLQVYTGAESVGTSLRYYLNPEHPVVSISQYLPGTNISGLSMTRLINEINRAFIPSERPDYSSRIISGGGAGGVLGTNNGETWDVGGAGLGTLITPTGGASVGGGRQTGSTFGGLAAVAVPVAIPILSGPSAGQKVTGIDSMVGGVQRLDDGTQQILLRAVQTMWDPNNPSQMLLAVDQQQDSLGQKYMTARYYYIDKQGSIYELKGGQNDLVSILNFLSFYTEQPGKAPVTGAGNVEPTLSTGGGVLAVDIGKTPILLHAQSIPFFLPEGTPQPFLLEWTAGAATTVERASPRGADIYQLVFPGKIMRIQEVADPTKQDQFVMQDVDFMLRRVQKPDVWEVRVGGGGASTPIGPAAQGGVFIRSQHMEAPRSQLGGGAFYQGGATNFEAIATMAQVDEATAYIESLHRIATTLYGSREFSNRVLLGALAQVVAQLRRDTTQVTDPATGQTTTRFGNLRYDQTFYRFVGILRGLRNAGMLDTVKALRIDAGRYSGLDAMMSAYNEMASQVGNDPTQAASYVQQFQATWASQLTQIFDNYYLGVQINKDLSVETSLLAREQAGRWTDQVPDTVSGRVLFTWSTGFWRAFAAMPLMGAPTFGSTSPQSPLGYVPPSSTSTTTTTGAVAPPPPASQPTSAGIIGTGIGTDLLNGFFLQRWAADVGLLVARYETAATVAPDAVAPGYGGTTSSMTPLSLSVASQAIQPWVRAGWFVQGAVRVFSNVMEDSNRYRRLTSEYEGYRQMIRDGEAERITEGVRSKMCDALSRAEFPREIIRRLRSGQRVQLTPAQTRQVEQALWDGWFYDRKYEIQKEFNGHMRAFIAASGYVYSDRTYWDVGMFLEYVDRFKAYIIAAQREEPGVFAGAEVTAGRVRVAAMGGGTLSGAAGAASVGLKVGPRTVPMETGLAGYFRSSTVPSYAAPFYMLAPLASVPEFGSFLYYTIGKEGLPGGLPNTGPSSPQRYNY